MPFDGSSRTRAIPAATSTYVQGLDACLRSLFFLLLLLAPTAYPTEQAESPLRVAFLPLESPANAPWIGHAVTETLRARLAGVDAILLIERERIRDVLDALEHMPDAPEPSLFQADAVLLGRVQLLGDPDDPETPVRVAVRIVRSGTGEVEQALTLDGTRGGMFELEDLVSDALLERFRVEAGVRVTRYRESRNEDAHQLFGEGLAVHEEAIRAERHGDMQAAATAYRTAIDHLRLAQTKNLGAFFAAAHRFEGEAREGLARVQPDADARRDIRQETVRQFRADAADAAPALLNLGIAYQQTGAIPEAVQAYTGFLRWFDETLRPYQYEHTGSHGNLITEIAPNFYDHHQRANANPTSQGWHQKTDYRKWAARDGIIYDARAVEGAYRIRALTMKTGDILWTSPPIWTQKQPFEFLCLAVGESGVYVASMDAFAVLDRATGAVRHVVDLSRHAPTRYGPEHLLMRARMQVFAPRIYHLEERGTALVVNPLTPRILRVDLEDGSTRVLDRLPILTAEVGHYHVHTLFGGHLLVGSDNGLMVFDPDEGSLRTVPFGGKVAGLWPGDGRVLVRVADDPRLESGNRFFWYTPDGDQTEELDIPVLYSYVRPPYWRIPAGAVFPLIDEATGFVTLVDAAPYLRFTGLIRYDHQAYLYSTAEHPWISLSGNHLWIWEESGHVRLFDHRTGELLWLRRIPDTTSGLSVEGEYVAVNLNAPGKSFLCYRASASSLTDRVVDAYVRLGWCQMELGNDDAALHALQHARRQNPDHDGVDDTLLQIHMRMGNRPQALSVAERILQRKPPDTDVFRAAAAFVRGELGLRHLRSPREDTPNLGKIGVSMTARHVALVGEKGETLLFDLDSETWSSPPMRISGSHWVLEENRIVSLKSVRFQNPLRYEVAERMNAIVTPPGTDENSPASLWALDLQTGEERELWSTESFHAADVRFVGSTSAMFGGDVFGVTDTTYVTALSGRRLVGIDRKTGEEAWVFPFPRNAAILDVMCTGNRVYAVSSPGITRYWMRETIRGVWALDAATGEELWHTRTPRLPGNYIEGHADETHLHLFTTYGMDVDENMQSIYVRLRAADGQLERSDRFPNRGTAQFIEGTRARLLCQPWIFYGGTSVTYLHSPTLAHSFDDAPPLVEPIDFMRFQPRRLHHRLSQPRYGSPLTQTFPHVAALGATASVEAWTEAFNAILTDPEARDTLLRTYWLTLQQAELRHPAGMHALLMEYSPTTTPPLPGMEPDPAAVILDDDLDERTKAILARQFLTWLVTDYAVPHHPEWHEPRLRSWLPGRPIPGFAIELDTPSRHVLSMNEMPFHLFLYTMEAEGGAGLFGGTLPTEMPQPFYMQTRGDWLVTLKGRFLQIYHVPTLIARLQRATQIHGDWFGTRLEEGAEVSRIADGNPRTGILHGEATPFASVGKDMGFILPVQGVRVVPMPGRAELLVGGRIQVSNQSPDGGYSTLHTIQANEVPDEGAALLLPEGTRARFVRFLPAWGTPLGVSEFDVQASTLEEAARAED